MGRGGAHRRRPTEATADGDVLDRQLGRLQQLLGDAGPLLGQPAPGGHAGLRPKPAHERPRRHARVAGQCGDADRRSKISALRGAVGSVGKDLFSDIMAKVIEYQMGRYGVG